MKEKKEAHRKTISMLAIIVGILIILPAVQAEELKVAQDFQYPLSDGSLEEWDYFTYNGFGFGEWNSAFSGWHLGQDTKVDRTPTGTKLYAIADGIVRISDNEKFGGYGDYDSETDRQGEGYAVVIEHKLSDEKYITSLCGHVQSGSDFYSEEDETGLIPVGSTVHKGQYIGNVADYLVKSGANWHHLHFGIKKRSYTSGHDADYIRGYSTTGWNVDYSIHDDWYNPNDFVSEHSFSPQLDLIILIDTTGSMGPYINSAKASASEIVEALDSTGFDYRVAVADYRDYPHSPYGGLSDYVYNLNQPFSNDKDEIISSINSLNLGWGADWRESVYSALVLSMTDTNKDTTRADNYGWRNGASKAIIIMGDAPPHIPELWIGGYALSDVTYWSENIDPIAVYSIVIGNGPDTYAAFSEISEKTGGKVYSAETASEAADAIIEAIGDIGAGEYGVNVEITPAHNEANPGNPVVYSVNITNKGDVADIYNVSFGAENIFGSHRGYPMAIQSSWIVFDSAQVTLNPEMSEVRPLTITVPENWAGMENITYTFSVSATSTTDETISNTSTAELEVKANKRSMAEYSKLEVEWLSRLIESSDIDQEIKDSLLDKLTNASLKLDQAIINIDNGKIKTADNMLVTSQNIMSAFINQVEAQYDKKIMQPDADVLVEKASQIVEDLEKVRDTKI